MSLLNSITLRRISSILLILVVLGTGQLAANWFSSPVEGAPQTRKSSSNQQRNKRKTNTKKKRSNLPTTRKIVPIRIAKVDPKTLPRVKIGAERIDALVQQNYQQHGVKANPPTTDSEFVRRIYLDITGTIPTYEQTQAFLNSRSPDKRSHLIDKLLNSPGYASHSYNFWANVLRLVDRPNNNILATPYNDWVKQAMRDNMPYDQMVRAMLTSEGKVWNTPATGYVLRDAGMPLDALNNTVRVFLGTRIGCAQCHDHPFDHWTQKEFYELAAYTWPTRTRLNRQDGIMGNPLLRLRKQLEESGSDNKGIGTFQRLVRANQYSVVDDERRKLRFPHDYQYDDAKPKQVVKPQFIFAEDAAPTELGAGRELFAAWLTSNQNEAFAKTVANRLWKRAFGRGLVEPVDDFRDENEVENPALLDYLVQIITYLNYDLKEFQRVIYNTKTYQQKANAELPSGEELYHFSGPLLRRMTAEQVWDSLLTLAIYNPDSVLRPSTLDMKSVVELDLNKVTASEVVRKAKEFDERFGRPAINRFRKKYAYKGQLLARASEQPSPLPPGHFLRQFGQGDRELISGANQDGSVPQILTMFNGQVTHMMLERGSVIYDNVIDAKTPNDRIDVIFYSILGRAPTREDRSLAMREIQANKNTGYGNVIWSLINTREFLFVQ